MKKLTLFITLSLFTYNIASSQGCLPEGIEFTTQEQIDSFQVNYPGCTEIEGFVLIGNWNTSNISNLEGLNVLTSVGGNIEICGNPSLINLVGLENLISIGGCLDIRYNLTLTSLTGLENLNYINESLFIMGNYVLSTLTALSNINFIGYDVIIDLNKELIDLSGLENLININGSLRIGNGAIQCGNQSLINLSGLDNLSYIGENIQIGGNNSLISLNGLESLTSIGGDLFIGLESGNDYIGENPSLISISALNNLTSIGGDLKISFTDFLLNINGFENLSSLGGSLYIFHNHVLSSLSGLESLSSIGGDLDIFGNDALTNLSGLENIDAGSINDLYIYDNDLLSTCDVQSICDYLAAPNGTISIGYNASGCNSPEQVEEACESVGIDEQQLSSLTLHPNPSDNGIITINLENNHKNIHLSCFNTYGQQLHQQEVTDSETVINVSTWSPGIYLAVVYEDSKPVGRAKFVVQ